LAIGTKPESVFNRPQTGIGKRGLDGRIPGTLQSQTPTLINDGINYSFRLGLVIGLVDKVEKLDVRNRIFFYQERFLNFDLLMGC